MATAGPQFEAPSMVDFDGKHAELVQKLSEISMSMRQCADIVDSFNQILSHLSLRPVPLEVGLHRYTPESGPRRPTYPRSERVEPHTAAGEAEATGAAPMIYGAEALRRPSYPHVGGPMLPPAVPAYHPSRIHQTRPSTTSPIHPTPGPSSYLLQRTDSATSTTGPTGSHETASLGSRRADDQIAASERALVSKSGKRKRSYRRDPARPGDESDGDGGAGASPPEASDLASEPDEGATRQPRQPAYGSEGSSGASRMSSKGQAVAEGGRAEARPVDQPGGPSIVVFASGVGTARPRAPSARSQAQASSSKVRKEKKPRDPNAPKQPPPAYIVYQNEIREAMRARFPGHSPTELVKEIAATWKTLPNSERQRYKDQANVEKDRWVAELAAYQATLSTSDESHPAKSSEGAFLPSTAVSDSPPASSPRQSPRMSDVEAEPHDMRRVASQDAPSSSTTYGYAYQAPLRSSSSFPGPGSIAGTGSPRPGAEGPPSYPPRVERPHSRLASSTFGSYGRVSPLHIPSPTGRTHFTGLQPDPRGTSTRLPSFDSLGLGHGSLPPAREPSPRPSREHAAAGDEPASKRQRTRANPPAGEGEGDSFSHLTYEERKSE